MNTMKTLMVTFLTLGVVTNAFANGGPSKSARTSTPGALHQQILRKNYNGVKHFLDLGFSPNAVWRGSRPLNTAVDVLGNQKIIKLLLERGAKPNLLDKYGETALQIAAVDDEYETAELLVESGALADMGSGENLESPFHIAVKVGAYEIVKMFLKNGVNPHHRAQDLKTAFIFAGRIEDMNLQRKMFKLLNKYGKAFPEESGPAWGGDISEVDLERQAQRYRSGKFIQE